MKLFITTSCCDVLKCEVDPDASVYRIKESIHQSHPEWPVPCMKLVCNDIVFNDDVEVRNYGISDGDSSIRLVIKAIVPPEPMIDPQLEKWYVNKPR